MLDLVFDLSRATGWSRAEVLGLGLSEARRVATRAEARAREAGR